jgi:outer membrane protein
VTRSSACTSSWATTPFYSAGLTLSQTLVDAQQIQSARAAGASAEALRATQRASELDVVGNARTAFFAARAARDLVGVARETLGNQEAHLRQVQAFVEIGTRPEIDLAKARSDRATAQVQLIRASNDDANARAQLAQAMGLERAEPLEVSDDALPPVSGEDGALDPLIAEALAARPELASFARQRRSDELSREAARAGYLPTLSAQTGLSDAGQALDQTAWNWTATVTLGWNLFGGGITRARVREAEANLDSLSAQEEAFRTSVRLDVDRSQRAVLAARAALDAAGEALTNAREQLRLAEGRYQAGAGSIIELGDAQVAATTAGAQRVQAEYDLASARARLLRALARD